MIRFDEAERCRLSTTNTITIISAVAVYAYRPLFLSIIISVDDARKMTMSDMEVVEAGAFSASVDLIILPIDTIDTSRKTVKRPSLAVQTAYNGNNGKILKNSTVMKA